VTGKRAEWGFTYLSLLFFVAMLGIGLAATAASWRHEQQRENERELLFIGEEFRQAIALYYYRTPGAINMFPRDLGELLRDPRYPGAQRYLRRIYRDPMRNEPAWGTVRSPDGGIMGVFSLSAEAPIRKTGFNADQAGFDRAVTYADWRFVYVPGPSPSNAEVADSPVRLSGAAVKQ
jgi:type II secretory pathway pseudopilin PulG